MLELEKRIKSFDLLGEYLRIFVSNKYKAVEKPNLPFEVNEEFNSIQESLVDYIENGIHYNSWFSKDNLEYAIAEWASLLTEAHLNSWINQYSPDQLLQTPKQKTIGVVMAGNIPMVGFHDYLCVLLSGHRLQAKPSSDDNKLIPLLHRILVQIDPMFKELAEFKQDRLKDFDAIIATGSNNTSRYFEYYFGKYPHIIRRNRNGVAVITGEESEEQLKELGKDVFTYFGLGCRNVSKIFVPENYEFKKLFESFESFNQVQMNSKYFNNYEYQKAIYLVNKTPHRDNGFVLFKEDFSYASPISVVYYEEYSDLNTLKSRLEMDNEQIQCIVGEGFLSLGSTQKPALSDFADGVDTLDFLFKLNS